jgi:ArsR family transcriptional regulator, arsenate/arsenite/antimonite-responsive transcriptional repressor
MASVVMNDQATKETNVANKEGASPELARLSDPIAKDLVQLFKLLSDETRLRILSYLMQTDELHVRALCDLLGQSQPAVSHHLALLRVSGLIESRRDGKHNFYRVLPDKFQKFLEIVFNASPDKAHKIRFEDYVLSYTRDGEEA